MGSREHRGWWNAIGGEGRGLKLFRCRRRSGKSGGRGRRVYRQSGRWWSSRKWCSFACKSSMADFLAFEAGERTSTSGSVMVKSSASVTAREPFFNLGV